MSLGIIGCPRRVERSISPGLVQSLRVCRTFPGLVQRHGNQDPDLRGSDYYLHDPGPEIEANLLMGQTYEMKKSLQVEDEKFHEFRFYLLCIRCSHGMQQSHESEMRCSKFGHQNFRREQSGFQWRTTWYHVTVTPCTWYDVSYCIILVPYILDRPEQVSDHANPQAGFRCPNQ